MKKYNIAVVGIGKISKSFHIPAIDKIKNAKLYALCDINERLLKDALKEYDLKKSYLNYDEMLKDKKIDIVIVATPNDLHCTHAIKALKAGKHVAIEKPMALTYKESKKMIKASNKYDKKLMVLHHNRFREESKLIKSEVEKGSLGEIYYIKANVLVNRGVPGPKHYIDDIKKGGGPLFDSGSHILDLILWFLDYPKINSIQANMWNKVAKKLKIEDYKCEDFISARILTSKNIVINVDVSYLNNLDENIVDCTIFGDKGTAIWPKNKITAINKEGDIKSKNVAIDRSIYASIEQLNHFIEHIDKGIKLENNPACSAQAVKLINKIHKKANKRK